MKKKVTWAVVAVVVVGLLFHWFWPKQPPVPFLQYGNLHFLGEWKLTSSEYTPDGYLTLHFEEKTWLDRVKERLSSLLP